MSVNVKAIIREGVNAYHAGNREEAKTLLLKAIEIEEDNEDAWMWLSGVVDTIEDQQICLENVLTINPNNEKARQGLAILQQKAANAPDALAGLSESATTPSYEEDAFANVSFTAETPPAPASTPAYTDDDEDELPDDTNWAAVHATETSSASRVIPVEEPSPAEYDDWVSNLNLGKSSDNPFGDIEDDFPAADPAYIAEESIFGFDEEEDLSATYEEPAFAATDYDDFDEDEDGPFDFSNDAEAFFKDPEPEISPRVPDSAARYSPDDSSRNMLLSDDDDDYDDEDDERFDASEYADEFDLDSVKPSDYFNMIPKEIQATRLPGTNEKHPILVIVALTVLFLLNLGAIGYLFITLTR